MSSTTATHSAAESAENRGPIILGVNVTITLIAAVVVVLRTISRSVVVRHMGLDDWFMIAATFAAVSNIVVVCFSVHYGAGRHLWTIKKTQVLPSGILRYTTHIMYPIISGLIKISILFLYLRIFSPIRKAILATFFLVIAMTLAVALATAFECNPIAASWNPSGIKNYTCFNSIVFNYTASALYSVTDVWILILPVPTVLSLQISQRQKKVLLGIFSLGFISCIAGIVRMAYLVKFWDSEDPTWDTFAVSVTSGCELALGIIAASVPALKPLIDRYAPAVFKSSRNQSQATRQRVYGTVNETSKGYGIRSNVGSIPLQSFSARDKDVLYRSEGDAESTKGIKRAYVDEMKAESTGS